MAATSPLAVTPNRAGHATYAATIGLAAGSLMGISALGAAYLAIRYGQTDFVPKSMKFDNYTGAVTLASMVLASFAAHWGSVSARVGNRRWGATGFGVSALIGLAALNMIWFIGKSIELPVAATPYAVLVYALLTVAGLAVTGGIAASIAGLTTAFGGHSGPSSSALSRAAAWGQHIAGLSWLLTFALVFLKK